jgi:hypothetical protein
VVDGCIGDCDLWIVVRNDILLAGAALAGAYLPRPWIIAWQMNLQHEIIMGIRPRGGSSMRRLASGPARCGCPFRSTVRHHQDANLTHPFEDPEGYYWTKVGWADLGPLGRALAVIQSTLIGRVVLGPTWIVARSLRRTLGSAWCDRPGAR